MLIRLAQTKLATDASPCLPSPNVSIEIFTYHQNKINLEMKENKIQKIVRQINTMASSDVMRGIEKNVILVLFETSIIPSFTNNCESWTLTKTEEDQIDKIGLRTIKRLFNLPTTTPSTAIIYSLGLLYMTQLINKKRFMYLHSP